MPTNKTDDWVNGTPYSLPITHGDYFIVKKNGSDWKFANSDNTFASGARPFVNGLAVNGTFPIVGTLKGVTIQSNSLATGGSDEPITSSFHTDSTIYFNQISNYYIDTDATNFGLSNHGNITKGPGAGMTLDSYSLSIGHQALIIYAIQQNTPTTNFWDFFYVLPLSLFCIHPSTIVDKLGVPISQVTSFDEEGYLDNLKLGVTNRFVKISKNALAENVPSDDLLLTPGHYIKWEDKEVKVKDLVNGTTITEVKLNESVVVHCLMFKKRTAVKMHNVDVMQWTKKSFDKMLKDRCLEYNDGITIGEINV